MDDPKVYVNPRRDNQEYEGRIVYVDTERGICVQLVGQKSLFVHRLKNLERLPQVGETFKISYSDGVDRAKVQHVGVRLKVRRL